MADVGVLNLQIHDNSEQAAGGLDHLADALGRVKAAVEGVKLGSVATGLKKIADVVNESISGSTIVKLGQLADELSKLKGVGDVKVNIKNSGGVQKMTDAVEKASESMHSINTGFEDVGKRAFDAKENVTSITSAMRDAQGVDLSKIDLNEYLTDPLTMLEEKYRSAGSSVDEFKNKVETAIPVFKEYKDTVLGLSGSKMDSAGFSRKTGEELLEAAKAASVETKEAVTETVAATKELVQETLSEEEEYARKFEQICEQMREKAEWASNVRRKQEGKFYEPMDIAKTNVIADNLTQLDLLNAKVREAEEKFNNLYNSLGANNSKTIKAGLDLQGLRDKQWEYTHALEATNTDGATNAADNLGDAQHRVAEETEEATEAQAELNSELKNERKFADAAAEQIEKLKQKISDFAANLKEAASPLDKFGKEVWRIIKRMTIRAAIKQVVSGVKEGVQNMYEYSKLVGSSFAPAMDSAATALAQMRNSLGAALAPLLQALIPYLNALVNGFITLVNWANQFFSLLRGQQTWTQALPATTAAFNNQSNAAKKAAKSMKDLLADWDELNIIQNKTNSNGGGNGSSTNTNYAEMFEEVSEYDEIIKRITKFIEDHLGGIWGLVKRIGLAILGWKISSAFDGVLGRLGKLLAGGAILVLGVELSYGSGFEAGRKGYFDGMDLIGTIGGAIASAVGGSLITSALGYGSGIGFAIGIGVAIVATLVGYINGQSDFLDEMKWGNQTLTPEQVEEYVKSRFSFDVDAEVTILDTNINNKESAKSDLETKISDYVRTLNVAKVKVKMRADDAPTAINDAYESSKDVLKSVQTFIDTNHDALITTLKVSPMQDSQGNDITENILEQVAFADSTLKAYFEGLGKEIADAIALGERTEWAGNTMENALALMENQRDIVAKAEEFSRDLEFEMNYKFTLNGLTRENAKEVFEAEQKRIDEYREKFFKDRETAGHGYQKMLAYTQAAILDAQAKGMDTTDLETAAATYRQLMLEYLDPEKAEEAFQAKMNESAARMKQEWIEALTGVYGIPVGTTFEQSPWLAPGTYKSPSMSLIDSLIDARGATDPVKEGQKALEQYFADVLAVEPDYIQNIVKQFGISVWDITDDGIRQELVNGIRAAVGNDEWASMILQNVGVSLDDIRKYFGDSFVEEYFPDNLDPTIGVEPEFVIDNSKMKEQLKTEIENAMSDGVMGAVEYYNIASTYGWETLEKMLEEMGINLDENGMNLGKVKLPEGGLGLFAGVGAGSGVNFSRSGGTSTLDNGQSVNTEDGMSTAVAKGTSEGNSQQNDILNDIMESVRQILNKKWIVNVTPGTDWAQNNARSANAWTTVTGEEW